MAGRIANGHLSDRQRRFVDEYLIDLNGKQAAIRAGYAPNSAEVTASKLLRLAKVRTEIEKRQAKTAEKLETTRERVLAELARLGMSDVRRLFDRTGALLPISELDDDTAAAIASVEVVTRSLPGNSHEELDDQPHGGALKRNRGTAVEYVHKIRLWDKNSALDKLGKHFGLFVERHEHTGRDGGPIETSTSIDLSTLAREERDQLRELLTKAVVDEEQTD